MRDDCTIPQDWARYTPAEHEVWRTLFASQQALLPGRAAEAYLDGLSRLPIFGEGIPNFDALNEVLAKTTGWRIVAVPGLVPDTVFFEHLANRRFPAGRFIRRPDRMDYLEEPDVFHDVLGHTPMLMLPAFADYMQAYGKGGLRAMRLGTLDRLGRVYWYTVEFGLVREAAGLRIYGSGIVSSRTESIFALDDPSPHRLGFDLRRVMRTRYRIDDFQECYFAISGFDELLELAEIDFAPIYREVAALPDIEPGDVMPTDRIITRGTGVYHARKRAAAS